MDFVESSDSSLVKTGLKPKLNYFFSSGGSVLDERNFGRNFQQNEKGNFGHLLKIYYLIIHSFRLYIT